jgi:hypothetical protein
LSIYKRAGIGDICIFSIHAIKLVNSTTSTLGSAPSFQPAQRVRAIGVSEILRDNGLTYALNEISVSAGAKQVIFNALMASINPGAEVILPTPFWTSYADMVQICGGVPVSWVATHPAARCCKLTPTFAITCCKTLTWRSYPARCLGWPVFPYLLRHRDDAAGRDLCPHPTPLVRTCVKRLFYFLGTSI